MEIFWEFVAVLCCDFFLRLTTAEAWGGEGGSYVLPVMLIVHALCAAGLWWPCAPQAKLYVTPPCTHNWTAGSAL